MGIIGYIVSLFIVGVLVGGLGRLIVPGPNPIGVGRTLGIGLIGAFVGSLIGGLLGIGIFTIILEVGISAGLVYAVGGRSRRLASGSR
ncbi:MAG: GlsB/YeaQ/YmgE family stress response membrane protein [Acidimicrobiales bacterium]